MTDNSIISWGIIGCGDVTERKSGPAFNNIHGSRLYAVMRRNRAMADDYARRHNVPKVYDTADALINDPEVDAVYIATPPGNHEELALKVAKAGKPCYVEKPMARTAAECQRMVDAFKTAQLPLFVAYYRRALPQFLSVKDWITSEKLGKLREIRYTYSSNRQKKNDETPIWRYDPEVAGGGILWDLGSHVLDLFDFWIGPMLHLSGSRRNLTGNRKVEEIAHINGWVNEVYVSISFNFIAPFSKDLIELVFENGIIETSAFEGSSLLIRKENCDPVLENHTLPFSIQQPLIESIVRSIKTGSTSPSTGISAMRANRILDSIELVS